MHGQPKTMRRTNQPREDKQYINAPVNSAQWTELRKISLDQKRTMGELLDDAIALYLKSEKVGGLLGMRSGKKR
jgi:hypothetical protein